MGSLKQVSWLNIVSHLLFLHGLNPYYVNSILGVEWYLGCLAIFLFLVPFLYRKINSIENAFIFFVGSSVFVWYINKIAMLKCPIIDEYIWDAYWGSFNIIVNLPAISFGIFMYFFLNRTSFIEHFKGNKKIARSILFLSIYIILGQIYGTTLISRINGNVVFIICVGGIIISEMLCPSKIIDNNIMKYLGKYSYTIYLVHFLLMYLFNKIMPVLFNNNVLNWSIKYITVLLVSYLISVVLFKYIENPISIFLKGKFK